ncbi:MAG: glycosyltransferase [Flavobacteriales bacterium]|nr:glycosyltransferase [Flavobacteriales bacterium]
MGSELQPYKVLFLCSWYPNKVLPTNGNSAQRHAEAIKRSNNLVALHICSGPFLKDETYQIDTYTRQDVFTIIVYYKKPSLFPLSGLIRGYRYLKACYKGLAIAEEKLGGIDIVHHNVIYPGGILAWLLKVRRNIPYLITERWSGYLPANERYFQGFFRRFMTRKIANNASLMAPVSADLKNALKDYHKFDTKYKVIPNVADIELFQSTSNGEVARSDKKQILHISTLDPRFKNGPGMMRAIKRVSEVRQDFEFQIVCDGEVEPHVAYAKELGLLDKFCFFHGPKNIEEISEAMHKADFFVLFSTSENFPCVLVESLATGLPFIATKVGGIPEMYSEDFGFMIESKDEDALYDSIVKMLDTHQDYDKENMRKYAREHFSYDEVGRQYHQIYKEILEDHIEVA